MPISAKFHASTELNKYKFKKLPASNIENISSDDNVISCIGEKYSRDLFRINPNLLENFTRFMPDAVVVADQKNVIKFFNKKSEILFGYNAQETIGKDISFLFSEDLKIPKTSCQLSSQTEIPNWRKLAEKPVYAGVKKDGEHVPVEILLAEQICGQAPLWMFVIRDASATSRQQSYIAELEREIAHLSQHSLLGELAAAITHELSQPLSAISNYTTAAARAWSQNVPAGAGEQIELIAKAGEQAKRALLTVHRLRQLIQYRDAECTDDDLRLALEDAMQLAALGASQHTIAIELDVSPKPVIVRMDRIQIQILLANLIRNAIDELRGWKGERKMWISLKVNEQNLAEITVEDNGPGIAQHVFEKIFDPFLTTKQEGLGVGLAVSRRIAKAHGGRLLARNRQDGGAAFSFVIPLSMSEKVRYE